MKAKVKPSVRNAFDRIEGSPTSRDWMRNDSKRILLNIPTTKKALAPRDMNFYSKAKASATT